MLDNPEWLKNKSMCETARKLYRKQQEETAKRRFAKILETKLKTTMIGSISAFEKLFGSLWGNGKDIRELNQSELKWYELWQNVRTTILNNGNNQLRALMEELQQYTLEWNKYQTSFIVRKDKP
jgi:hypothetical protein